MYISFHFPKVYIEFIKHLGTILMNLSESFPGFHQFNFFFFSLFHHKLHYSATEYLFSEPKMKEI